MRTKVKRLKISDKFWDWTNHNELVKQHESDKRIIGEELIRLFCPYKIGMKVLYRMSIMDNAHPSRHGIIKKVIFNPGNGIDNYWEIIITPANKDFKPYKDSRKTKFFLNNKSDRIIKIIKNT